MKTKILLMFCVLLLTASPVMAIPSAGDYEWAPGGPLTGTFTSNGVALIAFDIFDVLNPNIWNTADFIQTNSTTQLRVSDTELPGGNTVNLDVLWNGPTERHATISIDGMDNQPDIQFVSTVSAPIPEPATLMLLSTGLVGLIGYRWRQGRREGQQVG